MQMVITAAGTVKCLYGEELNLHALGQLHIRRGSHVEPTENGQWMADLSPVGGPALGPFRTRSAALDAEREWLESHWLVARAPQPPPLPRRIDDMLWIFKRITDRLKTVLVANAALDLEAELLIRQTDRRAELLQKACEYEEQGFEELAEELRQGASKLCLEMPFGSIRFEFDSASEEATEEKSGSLEHPPNPRLAFSTTNGTRAKKTKKHVKPRAR